MSVPLRMLQPNGDPVSETVCTTDLANDVAELSHLLFLTAHFSGSNQSSFFPLQAAAGTKKSLSSFSDVLKRLCFTFLSPLPSFYHILYSTLTYFKSAGSVSCTIYMCLKISRCVSLCMQIISCKQGHHKVWEKRYS